MDEDVKAAIDYHQSVMDQCTETSRKLKEITHRWMMINKAVDMQANDKGLWCPAGSAVEMYIQQALRDLHRVIEQGDEIAYQRIKECAEMTMDPEDVSE